ncbi:MAG: sensor histidine kinase [Clostridia bacterium]|nr:sensor histidine kinase [Clostridia bacterium]
MSILKEVLRKNHTAILLFFVMTAINGAVFFLYDILTEPLLYATLIAFLLLAALLVADYFKEKERQAERARRLSSILIDWRALPDAVTLAENDYQEMIDALGKELEKLTERAAQERQDMLDYYTAWVHQIKTPIAVMRLKLSEDTAEHRALSAELSRIERYVDMVLQYIRIDSDSTDLVIREYKLDTLIREALRKQAEQFIEKRLILKYTPTEATVITDQKWLIFILDQLLSNAVKYTPAGTVTVSFSDGILTVSDTGIGIAPEDLPRVFDKGYTGTNGRLGQKSSGLGLYLAKKAADMLSVPLSVESAIGVGSSFHLNLRQDGNDRH